MRPAKQRFLTGLFKALTITVIGSIVGVNLGYTALRMASAGEKSAKAKKQTIQAVAAPNAQATTPSCPTVSFEPFSLFAEDYSENEGLRANHPDSARASVNLRVSGLPAGKSVPVVLTFILSTHQEVYTRVVPNPSQSSSIALANISVYLAGVGKNFLIQSNTQTSRGGVTTQTGNPLPTGVLQYTVVAWNGQFNIMARIGATAVTGTDTCSASAMVGLDLIDASFSPPAPQKNNAIPRNAARRAIAP